MGSVLASILQEVIERFVGGLSRFGHPDFVQVGLGFGLDTLGKFVEHIGRLLRPVALFTSLARGLSQGRPKS
jgi:hypothetical protein